MAWLKNHPGKWLRDDAAAAFNKAEDDHGRFVVNSAGRTAAEQQALINRWRQGGTYNRPPYLYEPANPPERSNHVANGGIAVDIGDWRRFAAIAAQYGFSHPYPGGDPVHFEFVGGSKTGNQITKDRQSWLNSRGWSLVVDGIEGPLTTKAYKEYQSFLGVTADGIWGPQTQAAHQKFYDSLQPKPSPGLSPNDMLKWRWEGVQRMLKSDFGYRGAIDNNPGGGTISAFQRFMNSKGYGNLRVDGVWGPATCRAAQTWLKRRWGYGGAIDALPGSGTRAAWDRAERANNNAYARIS